MIELKPIELPSKHGSGYLWFSVILIVTIWTFPAVPDMTTHVLYVLSDNSIVTKEIFHQEIGYFVEIIVIGWLSLWSIKKSVEIYNDVVRLVTYLKFRKMTSSYNPENKSPIHLTR